MSLITGQQIREARNLLQWSLQEMAEAASVHPFVMSRAEAANGEPLISALQVFKIQGALEAAGIEFMPDNGEGPGVRLRKRAE